MALSDSSGSSGSSDSEDSEESSKRNKTESFQNGSGGQNGELESEKKRRLDVFEFDEYDYGHHRFKHTSRKWSESRIEAGSSRQIMIEKRKKSYFDSGSDSLSGGRKRVSVTPLRVGWRQTMMNSFTHFVL